MRNASYQSFFTNRAPGGRIEIQSPLGPRMAESPADVPRVANLIIEELTKKLGRPPTHQECSSGPTLADDRTREQREARQNFKPKLKQTDHKLQGLVDSLQTNTDPTKGMSRNERLAYDAQKIIDRETTVSPEEQKRAAHLKAIKPQLEKLESLIEDEMWSPTGSQRMLDCLEMTREQLLEPEGDPEAYSRHMDGLKIMYDQRAEQQRVVNSAKVQQAQAILNSVKSGSDIFGEPEPAPMSDAEFESRKAAIDAELDESRAREHAARQREVEKRVESGENADSARETVNREALD